MQCLTRISSYGKCRCCLAKGEHQDNINMEDFVEFRENLNLFLDTDSRLTQMICTACLQFLQDVQSFRKKVIASEKQLLKHINQENVCFNAPEGSLSSSDVKEEFTHGDVKKEENEWQVSKFVCTQNLPALDIADSKDEAVLKTEIELNLDDISDMETFEDIEMPVFEESKKRKRKQYNSDSDEPISRIKEKKAKVKKKSQDTDGIEAKPPNLKKPPLKYESLKDNNRIRANILLLLKHSTILPFRNNFNHTFRCFYCTKSYIPFKELREHIMNEHTDISETNIDKAIKSLQNLLLSADISCIKCKLCDEDCKSIDNLIEHLTKEHKKIYHETNKKPSHGILGFDLSTEMLTCHICSKNFAYFKNLTVHMNEHYQSFVCYICGKKFLSEHRYKCHVSNTHENKETKCKHCGKNFKTVPSMAYHIKKEHLKRTIQCPQCPETFPFSNYIKRMNHMATIHGIKKPEFKCDTCGRQYTNSGSLAAHKRYTHKRTKEHRCELCGYITVHSTVMKNHMNVHNGVKNYECEFCKKKFAKPYTLKLHLKIHLNDKRFVCTLCDAAFIQKNSLKSHLKARHPDSGIDISKL